jgi:hypothetical protein
MAHFWRLSIDQRVDFGTLTGVVQKIAFVQKLQSLYKNYEQLLVTAPTPSKAP